MAAKPRALAVTNDHRNASELVPSRCRGAGLAVIATSEGCCPDVVGSKEGVLESVIRRRGGG